MDIEDLGKNETPMTDKIWETSPAEGWDAFATELLDHARELEYVLGMAEKALEASKGFIQPSMHVRNGEALNAVVLRDDALAAIRKLKEEKK